MSLELDTHLFDMFFVFEQSGASGNNDTTM